MQGYVGPIKTSTEKNRDFCRVLFSGEHMQLILMALKPGEDIGAEVHPAHDQFFRIEKGRGEIRMNGERSQVAAGEGIMVPAGTLHNLINTGKRRLRLFTLYAPPAHPDGLVEPTKAVADKHKVAQASALAVEQGRKDMIDEGSPVTVAVAAGGK